MDAKVEHSLIGIRSRIHSGAVVKDCVLMGQDFYETEEQLAALASTDKPRIGIGHHTHIERAIVDKNARIGDNCRISPAGKPSPFDGDNYYIRDGIVVIPKGATSPHGTRI